MYFSSYLDKMHEHPKLPTLSQRITESRRDCAVEESFSSLNVTQWWLMMSLTLICTSIIQNPLIHMYTLLHITTWRIFTLTFRSLSETFVRRSLFSSSSGFCHGSDVTWQEIARMCGSVCSCPCPGSLNAVPPFGYVPPPWSTWCSCHIPCPILKNPLV